MINKKAQEESVTLLIFGTMIIAMMAFASIFIINSLNRERFDSAAADWRNEAYIMVRRLLSSKDCLAFERKEIEFYNETEEPMVVSLNKVSPFVVDLRKLTNNRIKSCMLYDAKDAICKDCPPEMMVEGSCPNEYCDGDYWSKHYCCGPKCQIMDIKIIPQFGGPCLVDGCGDCCPKEGQCSPTIAPCCCPYGDYCVKNPLTEGLNCMMNFWLCLIGVEYFGSCFAKPISFKGVLPVVVDANPCHIDDDGDGEGDEFEWAIHQLYLKIELFDHTLNKNIYNEEINKEAKNSRTLEKFSLPVRIQYDDLEVHTGLAKIEVATDITYFNSRIL